WPLIRAARANLTPHLFPEIALEPIHENLVAMRCSPAYPEAVAHNVMLARQLCVAGCLFYELFTTSVQYSSAACEVAFKQHFVERLPLPCRLTKVTAGTRHEKILV